VKKKTLAFASYEIEPNKEYGDFDLKTGIFTVKKPGIFHFNFNGLANISKGPRIHKVQLWVDGCVKSASYLNLTLSDGYQPVLLSALQQLVTGQKVSVSIIDGELFDGPQTEATRFTCVFFS